MKPESLELWAIVDISEPGNPRFCYADAEKANGSMAVYDKKPTIGKDWKQFKKVIRVKLEVNNI